MTEFARGIHKADEKASNGQGWTNYSSKRNNSAVLNYNPRYQISIYEPIMI